MSDSSADIGQKMVTADELHGVVRTMKAMAASSIGQYEQAVLALQDYFRAVQLALGATLRRLEPVTGSVNSGAPQDLGVSAIVFGSDQGLVGQFNDIIADHALSALAREPGKVSVWAVGERVHARLKSAGLASLALHAVPTDVNAISALVARLELETATHAQNNESGTLYVFHNQMRAASTYEPVGKRLLPLDRVWRETFLKTPWPTKLAPEVLGSDGATLQALIGEYVFIALFQACAESLASENASRLAAMQRAQKNIEDLSAELSLRFQRLRQTSIDEELADVVSGFEASNKRKDPARG